MQYQKLHNPLKTDYEFKWDSQGFILKAGETRELDPYIAKHGAKHLCDYIILHKDTWADLGLARTSPSLEAEREEIYDILFCVNDKKEEPAAPVKEEPKAQPVIQEEPKDPAFAELEDKIDQVQV